MKEVIALSKIESFLKQILTVIFKETPFNKHRAEESLEKIKKSQQAVTAEVKNGYDK